MSSDPTRSAAKWKHYPKEPKAPPSAPNVLLILTDDVGYGASSTFGGPAPTPTFDALAAAGLRYTSFYTTAMCSPTRASLLTGRNHHAVASGSIADVSVDEEGYTSVIPKSAATIGRVLKENGYDTAFIGKNHNTPFWENSPAGPFDHWPNAWGFDYYYGFNAPYVDQFHPDLTENRNPVRPPADPDYILDKDLADHLIGWLQMQSTLRPDRPFFAYFASGSTHTPHQAPKEWIDKFKGQFDQGWDRLREEIFERQKKLGIAPPDAVLTPRHEGLPAWDGLSPEMQRVYGRMMEVTAAMLSHFDHQIGRIIEQLRKSGQLDNTLVIYVQGDNGASLEDFKGSTQEFAAPQSDEEMIRDIDKHGGPESFAAYPAAWGWANNAPFRWGKQVASHLGGLRDGMVISWPAGIRSRGEIRRQFGHVIDIAPTIYDAAGITPPASIDGVDQQPIDGTSLVYSFSDADAPEQHREQYFEMLGNRAYYKDGWIASTTPGRAPWEMGKNADPYLFKWELYDLNTDWSQSRDVSAENPDKLAELQIAFDAAARKYHVYPLNAFLGGRIAAHFRPSQIEDRTSFTYYPGDARYVAGYSFPVVGPGWTISASVSILGGKAQGPILVQGDHFGGHGLLLDGGRPTYIYNPSGRPEHLVKVQAAAEIEPGWHTLAIAYHGTAGREVEVELLVDGKRVAGADVPGPLRVGFIPGRGIVYIGRACIPPFLPEWALPASRDCQIANVKIEKMTTA